jgi:hypothetical protein
MLISRLIVANKVVNFDLFADAVLKHGVGRKGKIVTTLFGKMETNRKYNCNAQNKRKKRNQNFFRFWQRIPPSSAVLQFHFGKKRHPSISLRLSTIGKNLLATCAGADFLANMRYFHGF